MQKKMKEVFMQWREVAAPNAHFDFDHKNNAQKKSFKARIEADETGHATITLLAVKGYKEEYVRRKVNGYFAEFTALSERLLRAGDEIYTAYMATNPPAPNTRVTLPPTTNYYGVNNGPLNCNGDEIGKRFDAIFVKRIMDSCRPGAEPAFYTKFKLL
jgi:hypothetical protein